MKRILSLTLIAIILISSLTLTACDVETVMKQVGAFLDQFVAQDGRTTITENEWKNAFKVNNFTFSITEGEQTTVIVVDKSKVRVETKYGANMINMCIDIENQCMITETSAGWVGNKDPEMFEGLKIDNGITLELMGMIGTEDVFEKLEYNKETKSYILANNSTEVEFFFKDGKLVRMRMSTPEDADYYVCYEATDIGSSVVEIPEYAIINDGKVDPSKAGEDVRTTVTNEELAAHLDLRKFTIYAGTMQYYYMGVDASIKVADTALELTVNAMGQNMKQYVALIDGEFYSIEKYGDGYLATGIGATMDDLNEAIEYAREYMSTDYLVYNEEGRYYTLDVENYILHFYFEDGKLIGGVCVIVDEIPSPTPPDSSMEAPENEVEYMEIIFVVSDLGTTTVELPEYTLNPDVE